VEADSLVLRNNQLLVQQNVPQNFNYNKNDHPKKDIEFIFEN
jgi:hypothetical protein